MDNIYVYFIKFPSLRQHEAIVPCFDGYTVYIDERLGYEQQREAYRHAIKHIRENDFEKEDVDEIEINAHAV